MKFGGFLNFYKGILSMVRDVQKQIDSDYLKEVLIDLRDCGFDEDIIHCIIDDLEDGYVVDLVSYSRNTDRRSHHGTH